MSLKGRHLIDPNDFTLEELNQIFELAHKMEKNPQDYSDLCKGKILATLFYEPSTRTKFSFEAAMLRLGGSILGFADANTSSVKKGESISDTIRVMDGYSDIVVMRHPREGAPKLASNFSSVPIINGGDGGHQHPTQTLTDLFTINNLKGEIKNLRIALCGDLKYGRTVHSLIKTLARYEGMSFYLISPGQLQMPVYIKDYVKNQYNVEIIETEDLEDVINKVDVLYMTRIQRERFFNEEDYLKLKNSYILTSDKIKNAKENMMIMHPLPRVNEIDYSVDDDKRAVYFKQAKYGVYARMSLIAHLLGVN